MTFLPSRVSLMTGLTLCISTIFLISGCTVSEMTNSTSQLARNYSVGSNYGASETAKPLKSKSHKKGHELKTTDDFYTVPTRAVKLSPSPVIPPDSLSTEIATKKARLKATTGNVTMLPVEIKSATTTKEKPNLVARVKLPYNVTWTLVQDNLAKEGYKVILRKPSTHRLFVLDTPSTGGVIQMKTPIYQVHFKKINHASTELWVTDNKKAVLDTKVMGRVLNNIAGNTKGLHHFAKQTKKNPKATEVTVLDRVKGTKPLDASSQITLKKPASSKEKMAQTIADTVSESSVEAITALADESAKLAKSNQPPSSS